MMTGSNTFIFDIHKKMKANNVLLAFTGEFDMKIINALIHSVKLKLSEVELASKLQRKVYSVMVECLETVFRNYEMMKQQDRSVNPFAIFTLGKSSDYYYMISGNYVTNTERDMLISRIDKINRLTGEAKKEMYRSIITDTQIEMYNSDLSLVDISLKSGQEIEYDFKIINDGWSFCLLEVKIKSS